VGAEKKVHFEKKKGTFFTKEVYAYESGRGLREMISLVS